MKVQINSNWEKLLNSEFRKPYFTDLVDFVKNAYSKTVCYPPGKDIFRAFNECPLSLTGLYNCDSIKVSLT